MYFFWTEICGPLGSQDFACGWGMQCKLRYVLICGSPCGQDKSSLYKRCEREIFWWSVWKEESQVNVPMKAKGMVTRAQTRNTQKLKQASLQCFLHFTCIYLSLLSLSPDICRRAAECKKFKSSIGYSFTKKPPPSILKCLVILGKLCVTHCSWTKWVKGCDLIEVGVDMERYYSPTLGFLGEKLGLVLAPAPAPAIGSTCIWNPVRWEQLYIFISFPSDLSLCDFSPSPCFDGWDCCARFSMQFLGI